MKTRQDKFELTEHHQNTLMIYDINNNEINQRLTIGAPVRPLCNLPGETSITLEALLALITVLRPLFVMMENLPIFVKGNSPAETPTALGNSVRGLMSNGDRPEFPTDLCVGVQPFSCIGLGRIITLLQLQLTTLPWLLRLLLRDSPAGELLDEDRQNDAFKANGPALKAKFAAIEYEVSSL